MNLTFIFNFQGEKSSHQQRGEKEGSFHITTEKEKWPEGEKEHGALSERPKANPFCVHGKCRPGGKSHREEESRREGNFVQRKWRMYRLSHAVREEEKSHTLAGKGDERSEGGGKKKGEEVFCVKPGKHSVLKNLLPSQIDGGGREGSQRRALSSKGEGRGFG